jgi:hypothetical protein
MEEFLAKLQAFDNRDVTTIKNRSQYEGKWYLTNGTMDNADIDVQELSTLAEQHLIKDDGSCHWINHHRLEVHGFAVTCGEKDSFGWLTGCVETKHGIFVYG